MTTGGTCEAEHKALFDLLHNLDERMARVELALGQAGSTAASGAQARLAAAREEEHDHRSALELKIAEFGLAWFGSVILLLGIAFLMTYTLNLGYRLSAVSLGFASALGFFLVSRAWNRSIPYLSNLMVSGSVIILFYATVRLHYFTAEPLLRNGALALGALLCVAAFAAGLALQRRSEPAAILAIALGLVASLLGRNSHAGLALLVVFSLVASWMAVKRGWWPAVIVTSVLVYSSHLVWLLNNPVAGGEVRSIAAGQYDLFYLFLCAAAFFWPALVRESSSEDASLALAFFNCAGFSLVLCAAGFSLYSRNIGPPFLAGAGFLLACSAVQWLKTRKQLCPALYACAGYLALSIGISGYAKSPSLFLWLALQSLVVVCMALWFRSKVLVVANSIIFMGILLSYIGGFPSSTWVNFGFAIAAHASARVMNWQKERLTLRTEMLRNIYLVIGFVFVLYGLAHALPAHYVTLSWIGAAAAYFLMSIVLDNHKYRWLAIASVLVTIAYLLVVDLPQLDPAYRVPAFLVVGVITLVISMYYTRFRPVPGGKS